MHRKNFKLAIQRSERECFNKLCEHADVNPWGSAYIVLMGSVISADQVPYRLVENYSGLIPPAKEGHRYLPEICECDGNFGSNHNKDTK